MLFQMLILVGVFTIAGIILCILAALHLDASGVDSLYSALQSTVISIIESWFVSNPFMVFARSMWTARTGVRDAKGGKRSMYRTFEDGVKSTAAMLNTVGGSDYALSSQPIEMDSTMNTVINSYYKEALTRSYVP